MIVYSVNIVNNSISFKNQNLTIGDKGIYIVKGSNGVGKSTIIENIVFNYTSDNISKNDIAYIEQEPVVLNCTVEHYLKRYNEKVNVDLLNNILSRLNINNISKKKKVSTLSGGEICKLNIAAGLAKDSQYIFMDEPTNNLDDESVEALYLILKELSEYKSIIIVTHDKRIDNGKHNEIKISSNKIELNYINDNDLNFVSKFKSYFYPNSKLLRQFLFEKSKLVLLLISTLVIVFVFLLNQFLFNNYYSNEGIPSDKEHIIAYSVDETFSELNKNYSEYTDILDKIDPSKYNDIINYKDLPSIIDNKNVKQIIYSDDYYIDKVAEKYLSKNLINEITYLSIPESMLNQNFYIVELPFDVRYLEKGRLPLDNKKEVVLSKKIIEKYFNNINADNPIDKKVKINGDYYKIVGISFYDICLLSYSENMNFGYNVFNESNYETYVNRILKYKTEIGYTFPNHPINLLIKTDNSSEKALLQSLIIDYPANNYYSYSYVIAYKNHINRTMIKNTVLINIAISSIVSILLFVFDKKRRKMLSQKCKMYDRYYLYKGKTQRVITYANLINDVVIASILIFVSTVLNQHSTITLMMIIDFVILTIPFYVTIIIKKRKDNDY